MITLFSSEYRFRIGCKVLVLVLLLGGQLNPAKGQTENRVLFDNRLEVTGGIGGHPNMRFRTSDLYLKDLSDNTLWPPQVSLNVESPLKNRWSFVASLHSNPLPHTRYSANYSEFRDDQRFRYTDRVNLQTNMLGARMALRVYHDAVFNGKYWSFGAGFYRHRSTVFQTRIEEVTDDNTQLLSRTTTVKEAFDHTGYLPAVSLGYGYQLLWKKLLVLDVGAQVQYLFASTDFGLNSAGVNSTLEFDYREHQTDILDFVVGKTIQNTQSFEVYVRLGLH